MKAVRLLALVRLQLAATFVLPPSPYHNPPPITRSIQTWGYSTLREQIHEHHVAKVAIHDDQRAVEVLDTNGLVRRVLVFPEAVPQLIQDMRSEDVTFFVAPVLQPSPLLPLARALVSTLVVIWIIEALGYMVRALIPS